MAVAADATAERVVEARDAELAATLFSSQWYVRRYPDIKDQSFALEHYLVHGWREGRWPHPLFDPHYVLSQLPEEGRNSNPLLQYLQSGLALNPHPLFDEAWYRHQYMNEGDQGIKPLVHFSSYGTAKLYNPCAVFDSEWYADQHPDLADLGWVPIYHYVHFGWRSGASPNSIFDAKWYVRRYLKDERKSDVEPLSHYLAEGASKRYWPSAMFDPAAYLDLHVDVKEAGVDPLAHYVQYGKKEGRPVRRSDEGKKFSDRSDEGKKFSDIGELRNALRAVGSSYRQQPAFLTLPLQGDFSVAAGSSIVYVAPVQSAEGTGKIAPYLRNPSVVRLEGSIAIGGTRYVIDSGGHLLNQEESFFFNDENVAVKWGKAVRGTDSRITIETSMRAGLVLDAGINLMHEHSGNYFHFIAETLPRMILAEEAGIPSHVPYVFESGLHENLKKLITLTNIEQRAIVWLEPGSLCPIETMYYPGNVSCVPNAYGGGKAATLTALDIRRIATAVRRCKTAAGPHGRLHQRFYISRHGRWRNVLNQAELQAALSRHGFHVRSVENMDLLDQIEIFDSADLLVSPTGAQLTNIVWCRPGTVLNYLVARHPSMQLHLWGLLGRVSGTQVMWTEGPGAGNVTGQYSVHDDFTVDKDLLIQWVAQQERDL